jgi:hypothetical protein
MNSPAWVTPLVAPMVWVATTAMNVSWAMAPLNRGFTDSDRNAVQQ